MRNRFGGGDESVRHGDDNIAWLYTARHYGEAQRIGAAADGDGMSGAAESGEGFLEFFHHWAADESGGVQSLVEDGGEFLLHFNVGSNEIEKRNVVRVVGIAHFVTSAICSI